MDSDQERNEAGKLITERKRRAEMVDVEQIIGRAANYGYFQQVRLPKLEGEEITEAQGHRVVGRYVINALLRYGYAVVPISSSAKERQQLAAKRTP